MEAKYAPPALFLAGPRDVLRRGSRVSLVGSRKATAEGLQRARQLARNLAEHDVVVVSGLAVGIDRAAHEGAMEAGGRTVAVLGTPVGQYYPKENRELQDLIAR
jgi:DNA processing protein